VEKRDIIKQRLLEFFDVVSPKLTNHESYVIDFFVLADRILIIELNPFHSGAGAGLFSWKDNRELFMHGPLEMRVLETLTENPKDVLLPQWIRFIAKKYSKQEVREEDDDEEDKPKRVFHWPWTVAVVGIIAVVSYKYWKK